MGRTSIRRENEMENRLNDVFDPASSTRRDLSEHVGLHHRTRKRLQISCMQERPKPSHRTGIHTHGRERGHEVP